MDTTTFLAQLWGPVILAVGIGIFVSRPYYLRIYRELEKEALAVLLFGMAAMTAGIVHVGAHNEWGTPAEIVVTLLGWGLLLKGLVFIVFPKLADQKGEWVAKSKLISGVGLAMLLAGGYLSWAGYLS